MRSDGMVVLAPKRTTLSEFLVEVIVAVLINSCFGNKADPLDPLPLCDSLLAFQVPDESPNGLLRGRNDQNFSLDLSVVISRYHKTLISE